MANDSRASAEGDAADAEYQRAKTLQEQNRYADAIAIYRALADRGHRRSARALSVIYLNGLHRGTIADILGFGQARDRELGERYQLLAAELGDSIAQWNIALDAFVAKDFATARKWAARAADHPSEFTVGSVHCTGLLAWLFANSESQHRDRQHAVRLCGLYRALCARIKQDPIARFDVPLDPVESVLADIYGKAWFEFTQLDMRPSIAEPWHEPEEQSGD